MTYRHHPGRFASPAGALLCALAVAGCLGDPTSFSGQSSGYDPKTDPASNPTWLFEPLPEDRPDRVDREATMMRYMLDDATSLNPWFIRAWADSSLFRLLFDPLVVRDPQLRAVWNDVVVANVEELEGGLVHRVTLQSDLRWHDGAPFTSRDVEFSYEAIEDENVPAVDYKYKTAEIADIRVLDDRTLDIVHREVSALRVDNLYFPILPAHLLDIPEERAKDPTLRVGEFYNRYLREQGIGNGPYRFVEWIPGDRVVIERWEDYPGPKPPIRRQIITSQPDRNSALLQFRKGTLDDIWFTVQQHGSQTSDEDFPSIGGKAWDPRWMQAYIGWNMSGDTPFFEDRRVRQAMAHAYNREKLLRQVTWNVYQPSNGMFGPTHWAHNSEIEPLAYDLGRAAELLDEAGWTVDEEDGWRYREIDGERVQFHFVLNMAQSFVDAKRLVDIYRDDLKRIGVSFDTEIQENASRSPAMLQGELTAHVDTYQVFADPDIWRNFFHTDAIENGRNYDRYSNPEVDALFDSSRLELDPEKRAAIFGEIQAKIFDDQPVLWLWEYSTTWGFSKRMRGVEVGPAGVLGFAPGPRAWWIEKEGSGT